MGPRKPEVEYISLKKLAVQKQKGPTETTKEAYNCLKKLANTALKSGPFSITIAKSFPHVAPSGHLNDFLSYAPYWWPENPSNPNTKYIRKDGKRNPDIGVIKDQSQLESVTENLTYLCLGYYFFDNDNYAKKAVELLDIFFLKEETRMNPNLNYAQLVRGSQNTTKMGRGEGVISSRVLSRIANLLPLLNTFHDYDISKKQSIQLWFTDYLNWLKSSPIALEAAKSKNNIHTWYMVQLVSIQQFLTFLNSGNPSSFTHQDLLKIIDSFFKKGLPTQIDKNSGNQPFESKRASPFHYLAFNMQAIIFLVELADDVRVDYNKNLVYKAINHIAQFADDSKEDITQAVRCMEIMLYHDQSNLTCKHFVDVAYSCKFADKIGGPKNAINRLWSSCSSSFFSC